MAGPYVIGVDGGTESLRAGVFDLTGTPLAFASSSYPTQFPQPSWAEQDPRDWWRAIGTAVREARSKAGVAKTDIAAIALDTTCCSVVALDTNGEALRPALIWMDVRSAAEADRVAGSGDPALKINSDGNGPVSAEWMVPKALWLKTHEPATFDQAATVCEYQDYLNYQLTGRMTASICNVSIRWHYDSRSGGYANSLLQRLDLAALADKWPQEVVALGDVIGKLTPRAADHLDLPADTIVAQGGSDAFIGMIGLNVVRPGRLAFITGSSHLHLGLSDQAFHAKGVWGTYPDAVVPGLHVVEGGQTSTGSVVNWFKQLIDPAVSYEQLNKDAAALPPGAEGLCVLDHFQGNRTPYTDPNSRGVISGLSLRHGPAHIFRAIIEGVAFGSQLILETMGKAGFKPEEVVVCGGATRSDLWLQIHSDVSGVPLTLTEVADAPALGSAALAAIGSGHYENIAEAADNMVRTVRTVEPDMSRYDAYRSHYQVYKDTYASLAPVLHRQAAS